MVVTVVRCRGGIGVTQEGHHTLEVIKLPLRGRKAKECPSNQRSGGNHALNGVETAQRTFTFPKRLL
ncbi:hypothetical protein PCANC_06121 [Puccinia coronata f. sp. avenae]|uniref:Uncharacterized protein n=1 Tax=Puccinia coronata f. sp. avenae TaxID=200324 RepID=A0A2N5SWS4_9BASI|nr:hypothetical protein PCANC_10886 [Puccinia coronata f. sp. avenae]PLW38353.1 hypothetical protein PCASD_10555 [Puccinia coronata f. sp. avenae]PLW53426.1 hypothetical protein PCANC_06121 [Puccinia coronata f. sp. avenae]